MKRIRLTTAVVTGVVVLLPVLGTSAAYAATPLPAGSHGLVHRNDIGDGNSDKDGTGGTDW
jgi:hypothetical protein